MNEFCSVWSYIQLYTNSYHNCTQAFQDNDLNSNGYMGFYEGIILARNYFGLSKEKATQIDCAMCLSNQSLYYS